MNEPGREDFTEALDPQDRIREAFMLGLRTRDGVDLDALAARTAIDPRQGREHAISRRKERGDLIEDGSHLRIPRDRWLHLDSIVTDLF